VAPFVAGKNKIINGDCFYNQRGFSSQTLTTETSVYIVDRFTGTNILSGSSTFSVQQFTPGSAPVAGYEAKQYLRAVTTGQDSIFTGTILGQTVEDVRTFAGQTVTVSFWAKAASGTPNVSFEFRQVFGTGGSPSATVENAGGTQKFAITTSWVRYSRTITLPSISGKTLGTDNNSKLEYNIWVSAGSAFDSRTGSLGIQTNTFDLWGFQLEAGSVATSFTTATGTLQGEFAACQRYFTSSFPNGVAPGNKSGSSVANGNDLSNYSTTVGNAYTTFKPFQVPMRTAPSVTIFNMENVGTATWSLYNSSTKVSDTAPLSVDVSARGFLVYFSGATITVSNGGWSANAEL
jgi:hypothetical protein